jgi:hypothetical protein
VIYYLTADGMYGYVRTEAEVPEGAEVIEQADYEGSYWFATPGGGFGEVSDAVNVPENATELITKADYDVLVQAAHDAQVAEAAAELQASYQRYRDGYAEARTAGLGQMMAMALASQVGTQPPDFNPTWPPI